MEFAINFFPEHEVPLIMNAKDYFVHNIGYVKNSINSKDIWFRFVLLLLQRMIALWCVSHDSHSHQARNFKEHQFDIGIAHASGGNGFASIDSFLLLSL